MKPGRYRRGVRRLTAAAVLCVLALGPCLALPKESARWIKVETANFVLYGDAGAGRIAQIGQNLERLREFLTKATKGLSVHSPLPTYIYVFKNERTFAPYNLDETGEPARVAGFFVGAPDANYVAVDAAAAAASFEVIYHEYLHYFMNNNLPNLPQWLDEGFAEFYSTFRVRGDKAEIGRLVGRHLATLRIEPMIPLEQLFSVTVASEDYHGERAGTFYAQSWALTHYLMVGDETGQAGINDYVNLLIRGTDAVEAFHEAFGYGLEQAEDRLRAYLKREHLTFLIYGIDDGLEKQRVRTTALERKEIVFRLGELLSYSAPVQFESAERHYREALRLDDADAPSYVGLGRLKEMQGRHDEAAELYERAIAIEPDYAPAYERYGHSVLQEYLAGVGDRLELDGETPAAVAKARALFEKSLELDSTSMNAQAGFGKTYLFGGEEIGRGIASLTKAATALPARTDIQFDLLVLHVQAGNELAARAVLDGWLRQRADDELLAHAESVLVNLDLRRVDALFAEGKIDEATAVLERVADETRDPELEHLIRARLAASRASAEIESVLGLYRLAIDEINAGNYEVALTILEQVVPLIDEPGLRAEGESHIARLKAVTRHNGLVASYNRAMKLANAGDLQGATRLLEQLLADQPENDLRTLAEETLSNLKDRR